MSGPLILAVNGESMIVRGRTAALVLALVVHQERVNAAGRMGKVELNWTSHHIVPVLEESLGRHVLTAA